MNMLDAASGGVFVDKTPIQEKNLIENMTANSHKFGTNRSDSAPRRSNEVNVSSLEQQLIDLTSLVCQMDVGNGKNVKVCGICTARGHSTDMCPTLQEETREQVNAAGGFPGAPQRNYDPYSNTYNPGWKDHPNLRYGNPPETRASIQHLNTQVGQLATAINRLEAKNSSSLPSQIVVNPKENVSAITLRGGRELKVHEEEVKEPVQNEDEEKSKVEETELNHEEAPRGKFPPLSECKPVAPFSLALKESRKDEDIKGLYEVFCRCEVNIPLLDAIKQRKHKLKGFQKVELGEQVSAIIQRNVLTKFKDQRPLNETEIVIQMTDRSTIHPRGVLEDVFVQVDINNDTLTIEFDEEIVKFHIFDTLKIPGCESVVNHMDVNNHSSLEHKKVVKGVPKTESKLPPDKAIGIPIGKGKHSQETGTSKKSKKNKHRQKITTKLFKWVKVDKGTRYEPP
ncbi:uncharacterized protein [Henckelia pumila]|uniref:uncharacterized protein n=1 Tax=Henckelia pumila TaxID=405737 RepID=UPI003C6E48E5